MVRYAASGWNEDLSDVGDAFAASEYDTDLAEISARRLGDSISRSSPRDGEIDHRPGGRG